MCLAARVPCRSELMSAPPLRPPCILLLLSPRQVLPPVILLVWLVTVVNGLCKGKCKMPRLDGEHHKTADIIDDAEMVVGLERRRYEKSFAQSKAFRSRDAQLQSSSNSRLREANGACANGVGSGQENALARGMGMSSEAAVRWKNALKTLRSKMGIEMSPMGGDGDDDRKVLAKHDTCAEVLSGAEAGRGGAEADVELGLARVDVRVKAESSEVLPACNVACVGWLLLLRSLLG